MGPKSNFKAKGSSNNEPLNESSKNDGPKSKIGGNRVPTVSDIVSDPLTKLAGELWCSSTKVCCNLKSLALFSLSVFRAILRLIKIQL
jgi:hypothetical protein